MAQIFYGVSRALDAADTNAVVSTGAADTTKEVQIVVTTGVGVTRLQAKTLVERLIRYIEAEDRASVLSG
jgi:hypothetical protein